MEICTWVKSSVMSVTKDMLETRGYPVVISESTQEEVDDAFINGGVLRVHSNSEGRQFHVLVTREKIGIKFIREMESKFTNGEAASIIVVALVKLTPPAHKRLWENDISSWFNVFMVNEVVRNIMKHSLVPSHVKVDTKDLPELLKTWKETDASHLPITFSTDPVARFLGLRDGDVVRIEASDGTQVGNQVMYSVIKNPY